MDQDTLDGARKDVYVLLKILKYATDSKAKSYECKYAVDTVFYNNEPDSEKLGVALREVLQSPTLRGKFASVHPDLGNMGVTKVEIQDNAVDFRGNLDHYKNDSSNSNLIFRIHEKVFWG